MPVVEDQGLLDELVVSLKLVNVVLIVDDVVLILLQLVHLVLQGGCDLDGAPGNLLVQSTGDTWVSGSRHAHSPLDATPAAANVASLSQMR